MQTGPDIGADKRMSPKADVLKGKTAIDAAVRHTADPPLVFNGNVITGNIKKVVPQHRYFGNEVQCLMHAFGEVRHCAREVLELVEDAVRMATRNAAIAAADFNASRGRFGERSSQTLHHVQDG